MKILRYFAVDSQIVLAKFHENLLKIGLEIGEKHVLQVYVTLAVWV